MSKSSEPNKIDIELSELTNKIKKISIENDAFKDWMKEDWEPFVNQTKQDYNFDNLSESLRDSIDEYFDDKFHFIVDKLLNCNHIIMSICLRQLLEDIYKYNYYLFRISNGNKKNKTNKIAQYDTDEKFSNKKERERNQLDEDKLLSESKFISKWANILFKNFKNNYEKTREEIEIIKNHLSKSIHSNSVLFFNTKLLKDDEIQKILEDKIQVIKQNLMVYNQIAGTYEILNTDENLEYKKLHNKIAKEFRLYLSSLIISINEEFPKEYENLVKLDNLKG